MRLPIANSSLARWLLSLLGRRGESTTSQSTTCLDGATSEVLMPRRIEAHGLDPGYIANAQPELCQQLKETCERCGSAKQCEHDLVQPNADARLNDYCANTAALDRLLLRK